MTGHEMTRNFKVKKNWFKEHGFNSRSEPFFVYLRVLEGFGLQKK